MTQMYQMRTTFAIEMRTTFAFCANHVRISCNLMGMRGSTKRADRRRSIEIAALDVATDMIRDGGPEALTMAKLAEELELSVGGLYRYYPSKGAILVGLEKRAIASYGQ